MGFGVLLAFVLLVIGEVWVALQIAHQIGALATIGLLVLISASGPWLVRRRGAGVWRRATRRLSDGEVPGREAVDGGLLLVAGVLLTVPGFITGVLGALLLFGPVRALVRKGSGAWVTRRAFVRWHGVATDAVINVGSRDVDHDVDRRRPAAPLDPPAKR